MKPYTIVKHFLFSVIVFMVSHTTNASEQLTEIFVITVGSDGSDFEDDSGISAGGGDLDGDILVYINGNPVMDYGSGGIFKQINQYLRSGSNSVMLKGRSNVPIFVKIGVMAGPEFKRVAAKKQFKPGEITKGENFVFHADISYTLPIFDEESKIPLHVTGQDVFPLLTQLKEYLHGTDYEKAVALLLSQTKVWGEQAYAQDADQLEQMQKQVAAYYRENAIRYLPPNIESVKLVKGETMVLVYSSINDNGFVKSKSLGQFLFNQSERRPVSAMRMVFVGGQWRVWE